MEDKPYSDDEDSKNEVIPFKNITKHRKFSKQSINGEIFEVFEQYIMQAIVGHGPFGSIASAYDSLNEEEVIIK